MTSYLAPIRYEIEDVGATLAIHFYVGDEHMTSVMAHSRHEETAIEVANQVLATAFRQIIQSAAYSIDLQHYIDNPD